MSTRIDLIRERLSSLKPSYLVIDDESHLHVGHIGSQSGAGHYAIEIASDCFVGKSLVETHKMIYAALGDLMVKDIHAVRIKLR